MRKLVLVLLVAACVLFSSGCRMTKQDYVSKGNKLYDAGKYDDAIINYDKAIQKDKNYGEAHYRLGLAQLKRENPRAAYDALYRAVQLMPQNIQAREQLGSLSLSYYMLDPQRPPLYYNLVKQISGELLRQNPNSFEGLREKGYLAMTDHKHDDAIALFRKAHEVNPSDPAVVTALVQNLLVTGHAAEAEKLGLDLIAHQKSYAAIYDVMYQWFINEKRLADAESIVKTKATNNPKEASYWLELAAHYDGVQKSAEMQAALQHLLDDRVDFPQAPLLVGDLYLKLHNYPEAVRYYEQGARAAKDSEKILYQKRVANALLAEGKRDQATSTVAQILEESPKDIQSRRVQASLTLKSGDPQKIEAAERELEELLKLRPDDPRIWLEWGRAEELKGNLETARGRYQHALDENQSYLPARYALARIGLSRGRPDDTLRQTDEILKVRPGDTEAKLLRVQALARTGKADSARAELVGIKDYQHNQQAQLQLGQLALSQKKFQDAEQIFSKAVQNGDLEAISGLADVYASEKRFDKALAVLSEGLKKSKDSQALLDQYATIAAFTGDYDVAVAELP